LWFKNYINVAIALTHKKMDSKGFNMPMIRFNENNFSLWKYEMEMILGTKMLLMVINKS
jgi:hypothetical protein